MSEGVGADSAGVQNESLFEFLDRLSQAAAKSASADEILAVTTGMTAEHLGLSNCAYADMDADEDGFTIRGNWHAEGSPSIVGHYSLADFGELAVQELKVGRPLIVNDNLKELAPDEAKAFQDIGIAATICMPLVKGGRLVALMAIHDKVPRRWSEYELRVIREVTERSWAHVERVRSEAELRASSRRFRAAIEATQGVLWTNDATGRMIGEQPGWAALTGQSPEDYQGFGWAEAVHPDDAEPTIAAWREAVSTRTPFLFEHRVRRHDGEWRLFSIRAIPVLDRKGEVTEWVGVHTDITGQRAADEALREQSRILETLNTTGAAIAGELELQRVVQTVTDAGVELTGAQFGAFFYNVLSNSGESYMLYTLSGAHPSQFNFGMPRNTAVFHPTFSGEGVIRSDDITTDLRYGKNDPHFGMPKGHLPVASYLAVPVASRSGEVIGGLFFGHPEPARFTARHEQLMVGIAAQAAIAIDNSRLYQALQSAKDTLEQRVEERSAALDKANEALRQAQKMEAIGHLTGGIAHDFNNLLTPIVGALDILRRDAVDARATRLIDGALKSAERSRTLIARLLTFARRQRLESRDVSAGKLLVGLSDLIERSLNPAVRLDVRLPDERLAVLADPNQLELALLNLIVNARDAMPQGGTIIVRAEEEQVDGPHAALLEPGRYVRFSVEDSGHGMDAATLSQAVEPFYSTKGQGRGTGLGLSMVHGLALQSGGGLALHSEVGVGTRVDLWLPAGNAALVRDDLAVEHLTEVRPLKILLVDDEDLVRSATAEMLAQAGHTVHQAHSGLSAMDALGEDSTFDVLVTDYAMPLMSGAALIRKVREVAPNMRALLITGYASASVDVPPDVPRIGKPFRLAELLRRIDEVSR